MLSSSGARGRRLQALHPDVIRHSVPPVVDQLVVERGVVVPVLEVVVVPYKYMILYIRIYIYFYHNML
jgi:hypothetical protein